MIPTCDLPQEPSPIHIVPYGNEQWIVISQPDWALMIGYVYSLQAWVRAAGPCIRSRGSDVPKQTNGVMK